MQAFKIFVWVKTSTEIVAWKTR